MDNGQLSPPKKMKNTHQLLYPLHSFLVGGIPTPLKNMSSSVGMIIPN